MGKFQLWIRRVYFKLRGIPRRLIRHNSIGEASLSASVAILMWAISRDLMIAGIFLYATLLLTRDLLSASLPEVIHGEAYSIPAENDNLVDVDEGLSVRLKYWIANLGSDKMPIPVIEYRILDENYDTITSWKTAPYSEGGKTDKQKSLKGGEILPSTSTSIPIAVVRNEDIGKKFFVEFKAYDRASVFIRPDRKIVSLSITKDLKKSK